MTEQENQERAAIFLREHRAKAAIWGPVTPYGIPTKAGPGPTQSSDSPNSDNGNNGKA